MGYILVTFFGFFNKLILFKGILANQTHQIENHQKIFPTTPRLGQFEVI